MGKNHSGRNHWASWICGKNGFIRARGTSRRWRRQFAVATVVKRARRNGMIFLGRRSMTARRGSRSMCADYSDGARRRVYDVVR